MTQSDPKMTVRMPNPVRLTPSQVMAGGSLPQAVLPAAPASLHFYVFAEDRQVYGPATIDVLKEWVAQGLVSVETWIYDEAPNCWRLARQIKELKEDLPVPTQIQEVLASDLTIGQLRGIRIFSDMDDHQLAEILSKLTKVTFDALKPVVQKGEHGGSMFLLLVGEAIITTKVNGALKTLSTLREGDFFGESTLIEPGPRPYDVSTTKSCTFLRLKYGDFQKMLVQQSDIAARLLTALVRHMSYINLATNERFAQAKAMVRGSLSQTGQIVVPPIMLKRGR